MAGSTRASNSPPVAIKFMGQRVVFVTCAQLADLVCGAPGAITSVVDQAFKGVLPPIAETRNQQRLRYFDLFFETQRCSARAYTTPDIVAKVKGGQEKADQSLSNVGQSLFELLTKNDDVSQEVKDKIQDFLNSERYKTVKKKFDELMAAAPKSTP